MSKELMTQGSFLGRGWSSPPTFVKGPDIALMTDSSKNINENLMNLVRTKLGERPFRSEYGTDLWKVSFQPATSIPIGRIKAALKRTIKKFEPRVNLEEVELELDMSESNCLLVKVVYTDIQINHRRNFVYPFYLNEGTHIDLA